MTANTVRCESGKVELHTSRLRLRAATKEDAHPLYNAFKDPEVMKYWSEPPHSSVDRTQDWLSHMISSPNNGVTDFVICLKPENKTIGKIGVWSGDEIGFLLDRSAWHQGHAKEALGAVIPYLFDERKFEAITADVDPRNEACLGILRRLGFEVERVQESTFQVAGVWVDSVYLRLSKQRWEGHGLP